MRHVGEKAGLDLGGPAKVIGFLVELRVQSHDPAVGIFEFAIELIQLCLPFFEFSHRRQEFLVLSLNFLEGIIGVVIAQFCDDRLDVLPT